MSTKVSDYFKQAKKGVERGKKPGSLVPAPPAEVARPVDEYTGLEQDGISQEEKILRQFDLTSRYGPCAGMTRLERWERASKLGLQPPEDVRQILDAAGVNSPHNLNIWHNRV